MKTNIYGPMCILFIVCLTLSVGLNIVFYQRVLNLDKTLAHTSSPVSDKELSELTREINRLSNIQYDVKTKQPIQNDLVNPKR